MTTIDITRHQQQLINKLRQLDNDISALQHQRRSIQAELERIYPQARAEALARVPKSDDRTVISVFNYAANGYTATLVTTPRGEKALADLTPKHEVDLVILALCTEPRDLTRLLAVPDVKTRHERPQGRVYQLAKFGYVKVTFTKGE